MKNCPYDDNGNYLIIQIEGDSEEKLEDYAMRIDELCSAHGGLELLVANSAQIWKARNRSLKRCGTKR